MTIEEFDNPKWDEYKKQACTQFIQNGGDCALARCLCGNARGLPARIIEEGNLCPFHISKMGICGRNDRILAAVDMYLAQHGGLLFDYTR